MWHLYQFNNNNNNNNNNNTPSQLHTWPCHQFAPHQSPKLLPPVKMINTSKFSNGLSNHGPHQPSRSRFQSWDVGFVHLLTIHVKLLSCSNVCPSLCSVSMLFHLHTLSASHNLKQLTHRSTLKHITEF